MFGKMFEWANLARVFGILGIINGGTGATTSAGARTNFDVYSKSETDALVSGLLDIRGSFDASGGGYPTTGGSGTSGAIVKGDAWKISVAGAIGQVSDVVFAVVDSPAQTASNWQIIEGNLTETSFGFFSNSLTAKTVPVGNDSVNFVDSEDGNKSKKITWVNIKATLKTYFDGLYLSLTGGTMTGTITMSSAAINEAAYVTVASAATCDIGAAASNNVAISGTTTITSFGTANAGITRRCRATSAFLITYNGTSLITKNGKNITTKADDCFTMTSLGSGNWIMTQFDPADGRALANAVNNQTGTTYTLAITDLGNDIVATQASAQTYTLPQTSNVAFPIGSKIKIINAPTSGAMTLVKEGAETLDGNTTLIAGATAFVEKTSATAWKVFGGTAVVNMPAIPFFIPLPANNTPVSYYVSTPITILGLRELARALTTAGTFAVKLNGTNITGLSAVVPTTAGSYTAATALNTAVRGDILTITYAGTTAVLDHTISIDITQVF